MIKYLVRGSKEQKDETESHDDDHKIVITLYSNGFIVDDGPFRPYSEPDN